MTINFILALFCFLLLSSVCECQIRCYVCSTQGGLYADRCGDQFGLNSVDASMCHGTCFKARGHRDAGGRKEIEVNRGCFEKRAEGCSEGDYYGMSATICYCNTELCNHGNPRKANTWTLFYTTTVAVILVYFSVHVY